MSQALCYTLGIPKQDEQDFQLTALMGRQANLSKLWFVLYKSMCAEVGKHKGEVFRLE